MKTIGVIGGLGPQATMSFEVMVHAVSQRIIPPHANTGYPPMLVYYHRYPPFIVDERGVPIPPRRPEPHLTGALGKLGQMVDFIVITSNAPHLFLDLIEETSGRKVLSMIDATVNEIQRQGLRRVGVLGLGVPKIYMEPLNKIGVVHETLPVETGGLSEKLDSAIVAYMAGQTSTEDTALAVEAVENLRARNVEAIILGCTEIPLLLGNYAQAPDLINPLELLAERAVRFAIEPEQQTGN
ncbi:MAG TPA: amino acid racemase [Chloroflexia bacterium]|nr:amino acid racemase [Chloroflexia bacterium]